MPARIKQIGSPDLGEFLAGFDNVNYNLPRKMLTNFRAHAKRLAPVSTAWKELCRKIPLNHRRMIHKPIEKVAKKTNPR